MKKWKVLSAGLCVVALAGGYLLYGRWHQPVADPDLAPEMRKLIGWLDKGNPEQSALAFDALSLSPPEAMPVLKAAIDGGHVSASTASKLRQIYDDHQATDAVIQAGNAQQRRWAEGLVAAYELAGNRNPAWDEAARAFLRYRHLDVGSVSDGAARAAELKRSGCDDPYILLQIALERNDNYTVTHCAPLARQVMGSAWPASNRLIAAEVAYMAGNPQQERTPSERKLVHDLIIDSTRLLTGLLEERPTQRTVRAFINTQIDLLAKADKVNQWEAWLQIESRVRQALTGEWAATLDNIEGETHYQVYRALRGTGWASAVPSDRWEAIRWHGRQAHDCFARAAATAKDNDVAALGVQNTLVLQGHNIDEIAAAFREVIRRNPHSSDAVESLAIASMKRWSGGEDFEGRLMHLAKAAALSRNYAAGIPQRVVSILRYLEQDLPDDRKPKLFYDPDVRLLIRYAFDPAVRIFPSQHTLQQALLGHYRSGDAERARDCWERMGKDRAFLLQTWGRTGGPKVEEQLNNPNIPAKGDPNNRPSWMP